MELKLSEIISEEDFIIKQSEYKKRIQELKLIIEERTNTNDDVVVNVADLLKFGKRWELAADQKINKQVLRKILFDYVKIYPDLTSEERLRFNHLLFQEIISNFNKDQEDGTIIIKLRGSGKLEKSWNKIKNANLLNVVRISGGFGSANLNR